MPDQTMARAPEARFAILSFQNRLYVCIVLARPRRPVRFKITDRFTVMDWHTANYGDPAQARSIPSTGRDSPDTECPDRR